MKFGRLKLARKTSMPLVENGQLIRVNGHELSQDGDNRHPFNSIQIRPSGTRDRRAGD